MKVGIIGGTGVYEAGDLEGGTEVEVVTEYGTVAAAVLAMAQEAGMFTSVEAVSRIATVSQKSCCRR